VTRFFRPLPLPGENNTVETTLYAAFYRRGPRGRTFFILIFFKCFLFAAISDDVPNTTAEMVARYVSLVPTVNINVLLIGRFDVWLTGDVSLERQRVECTPVSSTPVYQFVGPERNTNPLLPRNWSPFVSL
jgi:hypothetical protein